MKFLWIIPFLLLGISCTNPQNESSDSQDSQKGYFLEAQDSTVVHDIIASTFIYQDGDEEHLVFKDAAASTVYVFERDGGKLINQWTKTGDVPGAFSMASKNLILTDEGEIVVLDMMSGLRVFEKDGELLNSAPPVANQWSFGGAFNLFQENQIVTIQGEKHLLYSLDKLEAEREYSTDYLQNRKNLVLTNLKTGEHQLILPFPEGSKFLSGKVYPFEDFRPRFSVDESENKLYLIFQNEPVLYTYFWNEGQPNLESSQRIDLPGFEENEGWEPGAISMAQVTDQANEPFPARIQALVQIEDGFMISFSTQPVDKTIYQLYKEKQATKEQFAQLLEETKRKTVLLDKSGQVFPLELPEMYYESFQLIDGKIHWMKKPESGVEAEEFTVYWGELRAH
ncbi:DUF4221 family protein [Algoriphagus sp. CAU 1675]|uniref:DUF4221 family protein n=1 Tax=Algoriphagus sp. CAU 1675 TaxID=3032597 RepID=UPI0023DBB7B0|nr:DUF4221 family protein [Algoriphagus sp. CAU 1675]MDF2158846.1 DUF4221 family protein [Algoriphagus sp. CAU 1675]